ncbi:type II secretion system F family protein [Paraherbaspirillum soli]|uniref:Type II secretion system F family protein n=1 Tax=Paraherbaspirillum soli TaxID=631222 RepID=A0ABW0MBX0_9BURK
MTTYQVRLLAQGQIVTKAVEADDEAGVRAQLTSADGTPLEIRRQAERRSWQRPAKFALGLFLQELSTLMEAGLVLIEALEALRDKADDKGARTVLDQMLSVMYQGQPFSKALAAQPNVFPPLLIATVASSEGSGQLPVALQRYQHYEVRIENIRKRITGALVYPLVVMGVGTAILLFMLFFVIPRFSVVFESMQELPGTAQAMLWWAGIVQSHGIAIGIGIGAAFGGAFWLLRTSRVKAALVKSLWHLPKLKDVCNLFVLARFYRTVGLLIEGGTPALEAFELSAKILPQDYVLRLEQALVQLRAGRTVSETLANHQLTTSVAERLLRVGEQSGDLGGMCERIAHFHDGALDRAIEIFSKVFEPILMLGVGGLVGTIVTLLYMPIFELAGSIG